MSTEATSSSGETEPDPETIGAALGRVPSGLFIVTAADENDIPMGFLGSFVQQVSLSPPTIAVAIGLGREHLEAVRSRGRFTVSVLGEEDKALMKPFFGAASPFEELESHDPGGGVPVLSGALAWMDCRLAGEHNAGDHIVVFGVVENASKTRDGEPLYHTRKNGLKYS